MGFWDTMKAAVSGKPKRNSDEIAMARWQVAPVRQGSSQLLQAYREMPWFRAVVDKASEAVANVRWRVYRRVDGNRKAFRDLGYSRAAPILRFGERKALLRSNGLVEEPGHPILQLLSDPNSYFPGRAMTKIFAAHLDIVGETFLVLQRGPLRLPVGFWVLPSSAVIRIPRPGDENPSYQVAYGQVQKVIPAADVIHLRHPDLDDPLGRGVGMAFSMADELDSDEYAARFIKNYFFNQAIPAALISVEGYTPDAAAAKAFKESLMREYQGPEKAGKVMITGGKTSVSRLDTTFKDMAMVELRQSLWDFIRECYGVPPEIMGHVDSSNRATAQAAQAIFAEHVVVPRMEFLRTEFQQKLLPLVDPDGMAILDYDSPIPADRDHELKVAQAAPWSRSVNEWRELGGLEPLPEFDGVFPPMAQPGQSPESAADQGKPVDEEEPDDEQNETPGEEDAEEEADKSFARGAKDPAWASKPLRLRRLGH